MPTARAEVLVAAPIDVVWSVMVDTDAYPEWNPFVVQIDRGTSRPPQVGDDLVLHVRFRRGGTTTTERITALDPPTSGRALLEYEFRGPVARLGLVRGRRRQELSVVDDRTTRYVTVERLHGLLAVAAPIAQVRDGFERHAAALRDRAEARACA